MRQETPFYRALCYNNKIINTNNPFYSVVFCIFVATLYTRR